MKYTVTNPKGANERTVMHPYSGYAGHYDSGEQLTVYQTHTVVFMLRTYTWGRITETPDQYGRHKYVCIMIDNNVKLKKNAEQEEQPANARRVVKIIFADGSKQIC